MKAPTRQRGITLLELIIALAVLAIALMALISTMSSGSALQANTRDKTLAYNAAREVIEQMRAYPVSEVWRRYNSTKGDDMGTGLNPGNSFVVAGLNAPKSGLPVGQLIFPETGGKLCETYVDATMGMPKDLNRNGNALDVDVGTTYQILPVKVRINWRAVGGQDLQIEVNTLITDK